jgi:hypothetical protein
MKIAGFHESSSLCEALFVPPKIEVVRAQNSLARSARDKLITQMDLVVLPRTVLLNKSAPTRTVLPCKNRQRRWLEKFGIFAMSLPQEFLKVV